MATAYDSRYGLLQPTTLEPLPVLAQAFDPNTFQNIPDKLKTITVPQEIRGMGGSTPAYEKISDEYLQYAYRAPAQGMGGGRQIQGYTVPTEQTFQGKPLAAKYDENGNFQYLTLAGGDALTPDPNQPNILSSPRFNKTGGIIDYGVFDASKQDNGSFGSFIGGLVEDFGPMILAGLGANYLAGSGLFTGAGAGGAATVGSGALSPYAAQAAGAYGGSSAAAAAAAAGSLTGIKAASLAQGALTAEALAGTGTTFGVTPTTITPTTPATPATPATTPVTPPASVTPSMLDKISAATGISVDTLKTFGPSVIQGLVGLTGSVLTSNQATDAATTQANAITTAAQIAADAARFRPVGVTTRFGTSKFTTDAAGNVVTAGYTPSAEITGYQDRLRTLAGQGLTDVEAARAAYQPLTGAAQNLFSLGQGYLAKTPEQAAQDYISKQQALLAPSQQNQLAMLQNQLQQQGRGGLSVAQGGNLGATTPEMQAYYNSLAQSNLALAANADQEAQNRIRFGAGLFDTGAGLQGKYYAGQTAAYAPFATAMDTSKTLESFAQQPLNLGVEIGGRVTSGSASAGNLLSQGITSAAGTMAPANAYSAAGNLFTGAAQSPVFSNAVNRAFGNTQQPTQQTFTFNPATGQYIPVQNAII